MNKPTILVLDNEDMVRALLTDFFTDNGHMVHAAASAGDALVELARRPFDVAVVEYGPGDMDGEAFMAMAREMRPDLCYIVHAGSLDGLPPHHADFEHDRVLGVLFRPVRDLNLFLDLLRHPPCPARLRK
ncbi:response regulator [Desulfolutivibrio sulfoxidireducens]|uniref:response regulator n=1 Tax=Desulfolutivibrio sulfoxidireducens TaxID=2773299 RepID=UPI00159D4FC1|nr:response regulator [Desulfolutivibrio sulfoxidireducens]QLA14868.1 response regulator [Desulfolutivibrio sulfoxidireducens]QLA18438.1 response regulator [Desulfolutivibrio sulfoxidireducens]